jgi:hypothetical protein
MAAASVRPDTGPGDFPEAALLKQCSTRTIEEENRESPVQRGSDVVNLAFPRGSDGAVVFVDKNDVLEWRPGQFHRHVSQPSFTRTVHNRVTSEVASYRLISAPAISKPPHGPSKQPALRDSYQASHTSSLSH